MNWKIVQNAAVVERSCWYAISDVEGFIPGLLTILFNTLRLIHSFSGIVLKNKNKGTHPRQSEEALGEQVSFIREIFGTMKCSCETITTVLYRRDLRLGQGCIMEKRTHSLQGDRHEEELESCIYTCEGVGDIQGEGLLCTSLWAVKAFKPSIFNSTVILISTRMISCKTFKEEKS